MTLVYRYYDQAELERQLNARATVPDITPILARYASESARIRARLPCRLAVPYGASEPEGSTFFRHRPVGHRQSLFSYTAATGVYSTKRGSARTCWGVHA